MQLPRWPPEGRKGSATPSRLASHAWSTHKLPSLLFDQDLVVNFTSYTRVYTVICCGCEGDAEDADVNGRRVNVQKFLHHHGNVPPDAVLRIHWSHPVWLRQVWRRPRQVSTIDGYFKKVKADIALHGNPISELRDVTCHMGSHSVTYHPTQVNVPRPTPAMRAGTQFTYPELT